MSVDSVRKRLEAATPGPWDWKKSGITALDNEYVFWPYNIPDGLEDDDPVSVYIGACGEHTEPQSEANLALLAHAPTDLAAALKVIEAHDRLFGARTGIEHDTALRDYRVARDDFEALP